METRIIDLIKNPETLRVEDLNLLETEIERFPYMQGLRAIYLLGVHRFYNEHFPKELAKTAAYTTDKRILYNLINKTNENMAAALAASPFPFKTEFTTKTPALQEIKAEETPIHTEEEVVENTDLVVETQSIEISEQVSFVEENTNEEQQTTNNETPSIPEVLPVEEPQYNAPSPEKSEYEQKKLAIDEYIAAEMAKLKSGAATEEPSIAEKEEDVEPVKAVETISEKEEIVVEEVKAEEISLTETVEEKEVEVETEPVVETEEERFSAEELASPETFNLKKPKETTIDFYNRKQTGYAEETSALKEDYYSSAKPVEENSTKGTNVDFYTKKQTEPVEEAPAQKEDYYSVKPVSESSAEDETKETTIDFYAQKQTIAETAVQKEDIYSSEKTTENKEIETTIDFYARKQTESVEETPAQKENHYSSEETISESSTENEARGTNIDFYASKKPISDTQEEQKSAHSPVDIYQKPIETKNTEKDEPVEVYKNPVDFYSSQNKPVQEEENISATEDVTDSEKTKPKAETEPVKVTEVEKPASNSNVTSFISTWKSWLKIDHSEIVTPSEQDKKAAIIDKFIENNPKISPIKEDVDFIVKEKSNDISHLMTETLAQLYVEQKLYTKAIQAYKILQEKHPERTDEFEERIEEIKKSRNIK
ncbi:MAG: hypothetical protein HG427_003715 [Flavobacteriaceae bacterium]|nr:hypothetical protein [Flavobacteriaceae bacterium]